MKKRLFGILKIVIGLYIVVCGLLFIFQERFIFLPEKLEQGYEFKFDQKFEELNIKMSDGKLLNGLLFKADSSKGLIFYLHGNAGNLSSWGNVAETYTDLNYDVFIIDYRGYGKSEGEINGEEQLFADNQIIYNKLKKDYSEKNIILIGYSIGTGMAAELASTNNANKLILQAPYYSLTDMMTQRFPIVPTFLLKYKFATNDYLKSCKMPVIIFHGNQDEIIDYGASLRLKEEFKPEDTLITLDGQGHNGMTDNSDYLKALKEVVQ